MDQMLPYNLTMISTSLYLWICCCVKYDVLFPPQGTVCDALQKDIHSPWNRCKKHKWTDLSCSSKIPATHRAAPKNQECLAHALSSTQHQAFPSEQGGQYFYSFWPSALLSEVSFLYFPHKCELEKTISRTHRKSWCKEKFCLNKKTNLVSLWFYYFNSYH